MRSGRIAIVEASYLANANTDRPTIEALLAAELRVTSKLDNRIDCSLFRALPPYGKRALTGVRSRA